MTRYNGKRLIMVMPSGHILDGVKICGTNYDVRYNGMNISYDNYKIDFYNTDYTEIKYNDFTFKYFNSETDSMRQYVLITGNMLSKF